MSISLVVFSGTDYADFTDYSCYQTLDSIDNINYKLNMNSYLICIASYIYLKIMLYNIIDVLQHL